MASSMAYSSHGLITSGASPQTHVGLLVNFERGRRVGNLLGTYNDVQGYPLKDFDFRHCKCF